MSDEAILGAALLALNAIVFLGCMSFAAYVEWLDAKDERRGGKRGGK